MWTRYFCFHIECGGIFWDKKTLHLDFPSAASSLIIVGMFVAPPSQPEQCPVFVPFPLAEEPGKRFVDRSQDCGLGIPDRRVKHGPQENKLLKKPVLRGFHLRTKLA